jgi:hypothetical protein
MSTLDFIIRYNEDGLASYYSYDDKFYSIHFPKKWAKDHAEGTGPKMCENCEHHGSWNGVFIGYCANCAPHIYEGTRGRGMIGIGREFNEEHVREYPSMKETYFKNVNLDDVGDTWIFDSRLYLEDLGESSGDEEEQNETFTIDVEEDEDYESDEFSIGPYDDLDGMRRKFEDYVEYGVSRNDYEYGSSYDGGYDSY